MIRFTTLWVLWMLLTGSLQWSELLTGTVIAALITGLSQRLVDSGSQSDLIFTPRSLLSLLRYLRVFALALIQANLDMARRVLSPSLPIDPAVVEVETTLQSTLGKLVLANSITLTPGTLTV
ncbi:MAG TPA: cation:proton antiporter, partial [Gammaproteobacteria bacterium]|nr:cation:proton antiporter [Gammaproteobacteria bacterium]